MFRFHIIQLVLVGTEMILFIYSVNILLALYISHKTRSTYYYTLLRRKSFSI